MVSDGFEARGRFGGLEIRFLRMSNAICWSLEALGEIFNQHISNCGGGIGELWRPKWSSGRPDSRTLRMSGAYSVQFTASSWASKKALSVSSLSDDVIWTDTTIGSTYCKSMSQIIWSLYS